MQPPTVVVPCLLCGNQPLPATSLVLQGKPQHPRYGFTCPTCGTIQTRKANKRVVTVLQSLGAARLAIITRDEIARFTNQLGTEQCWRELGVDPSHTTDHGTQSQ